jgi:glycosyltransferase involved in cell wall biosynthesis
VATRCGGPEEIVTDGVDALLVPAGSAEALADALKRVATDPALRARLSEAGRRTAESRFSTRAMLSRYESLYDEIAPAE